MHTAKQDQDCGGGSQHMEVVHTFTNYLSGLQYDKILL